MLKLRTVETPPANFLASGMLQLGPILWHFPPRLKFDAEGFCTGSLGRAHVRLGKKAKSRRMVSGLYCS